MRIPFLNPFAVSCAVCLQRALTVNQSVPLASVPFEKKNLHLRLQNHLYRFHSNWAFASVYNL